MSEKHPVSLKAFCKNVHDVQRKAVEIIIYRHENRKHDLHDGGTCQLFYCTHIAIFDIILYNDNKRVRKSVIRV